MVLRSLPFLLIHLLGVLVSYAYAANSFENSAIVRTVELAESLIHVKTTYAIKALADHSSVYLVALGEDEYKKTSFFEAKLKGQQEALNAQALGFSERSHTYQYGIELPKALAAGETINLEVETVQTHATYPWPPAITQDDDFSLKYETDLFILSPYQTTVQRTRIRAPSPKIHHHTQLKDMDTYTFDAPVTKSGSTITYGPYNNIPSSANADFVAREQKRITVHYTAEDPMMEVVKLNRAAEISHWGSNLNIQDEIFLYNAGPRIKGHFSRLSHQLQNYYQRMPGHIMNGLALHLPPGIHDVYYYDLVGNVSTSHFRPSPSVPKGSVARQSSILEFRPRYPVLGGWNYSFTLGWDSPLQDSTSYDRRSGRYIVAVPIMTHIPGTVVDHAEVKIILPEGATDWEVYPPFPPKVMTRSIHTTYLDSVGRPAITFEYEQLTDRHLGLIYVSYKVPFTEHLRKPMAVATAFFTLFAVAIVAKRVDTRIDKSKDVIGM